MNIKLFNISGEHVKDYGNRVGEKIELHLDLSSNQAGLYFLHIISGTESKAVKLVVN